MTPSCAARRALSEDRRTSSATSFAVPGSENEADVGAQQHLDPIDQVAAGGDRAGQVVASAWPASRTSSGTASGTTVPVTPAPGNRCRPYGTQAAGYHELVSIYARYQGVGRDDLAEVLDGAAEQFCADVVAERLAGRVNAAEQDRGKHERPRGGLG